MKEKPQIDMKKEILLNGDSLSDKSEKEHNIISPIVSRQDSNVSFKIAEYIKEDHFEYNPPPFDNKDQM